MSTTPYNVLNNNKRSFDYEDLKYVEWKFNKNSKNKSSFLENIITFDIETANGYRLSDGKVVGIDIYKYVKDKDYANLIDGAEPQSLLYVWQCSVESMDDKIYTFFGRTWNDYFEFLMTLTNEIRRADIFGRRGIDATPNEYVTASTAKRNIHTNCYIHNLGFEFQHLLNLFDDDFTKRTKNQKTQPVFARTKRTPMKAYISFNRVRIDYRDTLCLTGKRLSDWCKDENLPVKKLTALPDRYYDEIRTPKTPLTDLEWEYSERDVVCMVYGMRKFRDKYGSLENIPLTATGEVRLDVRKSVSLVNKEWAKKCTDIMKSMSFSDYQNFLSIFAGGWTHCNVCYSGLRFDASIWGQNIRCFDLSSSYPASLTMFRYPVSSFIETPVDEFDNFSSEDIINSKHRWYAKFKIENLQSTKMNTFWSLSKTIDIDDYTVDNGKVVSAKSVTLMMTDVDWWIFNQAYEWSDIEVLELHVAEADYLCKELILKILEYFGGKQMLKGVKGAESKYMHSKQGANSIYGVSAQKLCTDNIVFAFDEESNTGKWASQIVTEADFYEHLNHLNPDKIFLAYQHAPWVTAWSRFRLFRAIYHKCDDGTYFDSKIYYCDTDSTKGLFTDEDIKWFNAENKWVAEIQKSVADELGFDPELYNPKNPNKPNKDLRLGIWDREDDCIEFCSHGAKRYVYRTEDGEIHTTIAGLPKKAGTDKIKSIKDFYVGMEWNALESHKLISCYNDNQTPGIWIDRDGNEYNPEKEEEAYPKYGLCLKPTSFKLTQSDDYMDFISVFQNGTLSTETMDIVDDLPEICW